MALHVLSNASSRRSLSSQPLKYRTHGGRKWVLSAANSYVGRKAKSEALNTRKFYSVLVEHTQSSFTL